MYVFIRKDLPIEQVIVQTAHAALESGIHLKHDKENEPSSLIVLQVKDKNELEKAYEKLKDQIDMVKFFEPDWDYGFTSFATKPVTESQRNLFKKYRLFKWS
ncbi:MAG TPA: peptidyl-tRNA hydrolase [Methanosarcina sp.]|nr:peptidyl-tRNA hydrolase [Methanosarcina sp.]